MLAVLINATFQSIRTKYPDVKVIVADDSINYRELTYSSVTQYKMPAGTGFNKGKSLAVSQVSICKMCCCFAA